MIYSRMFDTTFKFWQSIILGAAPQVKWSYVRADHEQLLSYWEHMSPQGSGSSHIPTLTQAMPSDISSVIK